MLCLSVMSHKVSRPCSCCVSWDWGWLSPALVYKQFWQVICSIPSGAALRHVYLRNQISIEIVTKRCMGYFVNDLNAIKDNWFQNPLGHAIQVILCSMCHVTSVLCLCLCVPSSFVAVGTPVISVWPIPCLNGVFCPPGTIEWGRPHGGSIIQEQHPPRKSSKYFFSPLGLLCSPFLHALISSISPPPYKERCGPSTLLRASLIGRDGSSLR